MMDNIVVSSGTVPKMDTSLRVTVPRNIGMELYEVLNKSNWKGVDTGKGRDRTQIGLAFTYILKDMPEIEQVIFDPPATIVYWKDGTKTVVKVDQSAKKKKDRDKFREDYGLAMAIARKYFGGRKEFKEAVENGKHCK